MDLWASEITSIAAIAACLVLTSFFSATESAITSLGNLKTKHLLENQSKRFEPLRFWLKEPGQVLTSLLIFRNTILIFAAAIATRIAMAHLDGMAIWAATTVMTFFVLVFCEVLPRSLAKAHAESFSVVSMQILRIMTFGVFPIVWLLSHINRNFIKFAGAEKMSEPAITEEELEFLVDVGQKAGAIHEFKRDMIDGIFEFDETKVREIMTPRTDIAAIGQNQAIRDAVKLSIESGYSRIPVYEERIDNIIGVVLSKDLLRYYSSGNDTIGDLKVKKIMRDAYFVPESKMIVDVFKDLKRKKSHMAIVIDEYGGTAGLVTLEDIIEEIVGEIQDEYDVEEAKILEISKDVYDVSGSVNIDEFLDFFDVDAQNLSIEREQDVDTIAGWLTQLLGDMPKIGQNTTIGPLNIEVTEVERHRIQRVRVTKIAPSIDEAAISPSIETSES